MRRKITGGSDGYLVCVREMDESVLEVQLGQWEGMGEGVWWWCGGDLINIVRNGAIHGDMTTMVSLRTDWLE